MYLCVFIVISDLVLTTVDYNVTCFAGIAQLVLN